MPINLLEDSREAGKAIRGNLLRTILTAAIIAIGITALVSIEVSLTALRGSLETGLSDLGAKNFEVKDVTVAGRRRGRKRRVYDALTYEEVTRFKRKYQFSKRIGLYTDVEGGLEIKRLGKKTNPNMSAAGVDEYYLANKGYDLKEGRNFTPTELQYSVPVAIVGQEVINELFGAQENPIGEHFQMLDERLTIVGVLEASKGLEGGGLERSIFLPIGLANRMAKGQQLNYNITVTVEDESKMDEAMNEAIGLMRQIRGDQLGKENSFEVTKSEAALKSLESALGMVRLGGFGIIFITLLGACIGLMNIMLVSVTERTREIGVRKSVGATSFRIAVQFLTEAILICFLGGVFGSLFGIGIGNLVGRFVFDVENLILPLWPIVLAFVACTLVGIISGLFPAIKAARLDPIESLRYE